MPILLSMILYFFRSIILLVILNMVLQKKHNLNISLRIQFF